MAWLKTNLKQYKNEQKRIDEYMDYKIKKGVEAHKTSAVIDHPDGSVTDEKIGNRTIVNPLSPSEEVTGSLTRLLSVISNAVQTLFQTSSTLDNKITRGDDSTLENAKEFTKEYSYGKSDVDGLMSLHKDEIEFSNGVQLVRGATAEWEGYDGVFVKAKVNGEECEKQLIVCEEESDDVLIVADESIFSVYASCDEAGNPIGEHYATKEEVGDIDTALTKIIEMQNAMIGQSDIDQATAILNELIRQQEETISTQNSLIGGDVE